MEPEKSTFPISATVKNDLTEKENRSAKSQTIKKAKPLYIWYFTPVSNEVNRSDVSTSFNACAPKAPKMMANIIIPIPVAVIVLFIV